MKPKHLYVPLRKPEDLIPHLGKGELHWKKGRSAYELAYSWGLGQEIPDTVRRVLETCELYRDCNLVDAFFEREVDLLTPGRPSQTDLMVILGLENELAVMAIEAKVDETFGPLVNEWNDGGPGKQGRLNSLCNLLGLHPGKVGDLRYQLLHRTASALLEARRYKVKKAVMLVQSFDPEKAWLDDFETFATAMGYPDFKVGELSEDILCGDVALRLGWCTDKPI